MFYANNVAIWFKDKIDYEKLRIKFEICTGFKIKLVYGYYLYHLDDVSDGYLEIKEFSKGEYKIYAYLC